MEWKKQFKKTYHFIFKEDSALSWAVNIILAFLIVKFLVYPGMSLVLGTDLPLVAVISGSMDHEGLEIDEWWEANGDWYTEEGLTQEEFLEFKFLNGFDKGDVMVLGSAGDVEVGDVLVYVSSTHEYPIIHRVVGLNDDGTYDFKGDNNDEGDPGDIVEEQLLGKALYRIPKIGWVKIWAVALYQGVVGG